MHFACIRQTNSMNLDPRSLLYQWYLSGLRPQCPCPLCRTNCKEPGHNHLTLKTCPSIQPKWFWANCAYQCQLHWF